MIGRAIISARRRSYSTVVVTSRKASLTPPTRVTMISPSRVKCSEMAATSALTVSSSPVVRASTSADPPLAARSGGALPSDQYDTAWLTPGWAPSSSVRAVPAATISGSSTEPPAVGVTSTTTFGVPLPRVSVR